MMLLKTNNYTNAIEKLMDLALDGNKPIIPVPRLLSPNIGSYIVGVELNEPYFKYQLNIGMNSSFLTLKQVRELESKLQTKLVS